MSGDYIMQNTMVVKKGRCRLGGKKKSGVAGGEKVGRKKVMFAGEKF